MGTHAVNVAVWERHARSRIAAGDLESPPREPSFAWTRNRQADPGIALLGDVTGRRVVELGCGTGENLAYLVDICGARGIGIDAAPSQILRARSRWPKLDVRHVEALRYLSACDTFDVCYSIFGAVGLCPTKPLLALIGCRLAPGGILVFSVRALDNRRSSVAVSDRTIRWHLHHPHQWAGILGRAGFTDVQIDQADRDLSPSTLIITARATEVDIPESPMTRRIR
ncbi:methyltransferase domain-containing protein [Parafrankia sp. BMG5.11]|uniref:methyltransferase domain-containing protein n=1 Tax=Parafrankia sp. BMG5.11 TaxID=222540 RepID=UPI0027D2EEAE|nr:methyltransferase domain-containing protein [Parafrankia sp. BMG5.11]